MTNGTSSSNNKSSSYHNDGGSQQHVVNSEHDSQSADNDNDYDVKHVQQRTAEAMKQMQALVESANATMGISPEKEKSSSNTGQLKSYGSIHPDQTFVVSDELDGFISSQTKPKSCLTRMAELLGL